MGRVTQSTLAGGPTALPAAMLLSSSSSSSSSLHAWFRTELEKLGFGIDAGFYTHHTLDILRQTDLDLRDEFFPPPRCDKQGREERRSGGRGRVISEAELECQRKEVAVTVLKNNTESEEETIQRLVDEVAQKVKEAKHKDSPKEVKQKNTSITENKNPEERYRAEFPALSEKCDRLQPRAPACSSQWANVAKQKQLPKDDNDNPIPTKIPQTSEISTSVGSRRNTVWRKVIKMYQQELQAPDYLSEKKRKEKLWKFTEPVPVPEEQAAEMWRSTTEEEASNASQLVVIHFEKPKPEVPFSPMNTSGDEFIKGDIGALTVSPIGTELKTTPIPCPPVSIGSEHPAFTVFPRIQSAFRVCSNTPYWFRQQIVGDDETYRKFIKDHYPHFTPLESTMLSKLLRAHIFHPTAILHHEGKDLTNGTFETENSFRPIRSSTPTPTSPLCTSADEEAMTPSQHRAPVEELDRLLRDPIPHQVLNEGFYVYSGAETKGSAFRPQFASSRMHRDGAVQTEGNVKEREEPTLAGSPEYLSESFEANSKAMLGTDVCQLIDDVTLDASDEETDQNEARENGIANEAPAKNPKSYKELHTGDSFIEKNSKHFNLTEEQEREMRREGEANIPEPTGPSYSFLGDSFGKYWSKKSGGEDWRGQQAANKNNEETQQQTARPLLPVGSNVKTVQEIEEEFVQDSMNYRVQVPTRQHRSGPSTKLCPLSARDEECTDPSCPYGHAKSRITCKFWEKAGCFKELTCPFLHGYPPKQCKERIELRLDDDFPEINKANKRRPKSSKNRKRERRKRRDSTQNNNNNNSAIHNNNNTNHPAQKNNAAPSTEKKSSRRSNTVRRSQPCDVKRGKPK